MRDALRGLEKVSLDGPDLLRVRWRHRGVARLEIDGWAPVHKPSCDGCGSAELRGLWIGGNGTIAAVGGRPPLVTFYDGRGWEDEVIVDQPETIAERIALNGVWSEDGLRFVAVGDRGLIVRGER